MAEEQFTISEAAREIGISRPTLYKYLDKPKYKPKTVAGFPVLSAAQVDGIRAERKAIKKNGAKNTRKA
jgi:predicted DNA-binding protein (UPF0251 family)